MHAAWSVDSFPTPNACAIRFTQNEFWWTNQHEVIAKFILTKSNFFHHHRLLFVCTTAQRKPKAFVVVGFLTDLDGLLHIVLQTFIALCIHVLSCTFFCSTLSLPLLFLRSFLLYLCYIFWTCVDLSLLLQFFFEHSHISDACSTISNLLLLLLYYY